MYSQCYIKYPLTTAQRNFEKNRLTARADWECDVKVILVNFHFIQKTNGTRNFTAIDDGSGGKYTGYDYAHGIIASLNSDLLQNTKMHIPPLNNTPVNDKKYKFVVRGVYFHQSDADWINPNPSVLRATTSSNQMQQFDVFIHSSVGANTPTPVTSAPGPKPGVSGYAASTSSSPGDKYTVVNTFVDYEYFKFNNYTDQYTNSVGFRMPLSQVFDRAASFHGLYQHEFNHLLTLDHTVMYPWGNACPTVKDNGPGSVDVDCDDFCWDTPTAWYMRDNLNAPCHPKNCSGTNWNTWGSNNRMEYSGWSALTPNQLSRIHSTLENGTQLRSYLLCERVKIDQNFCAFDHNITLFSGKKVTINKTCSSNNQSIVNNKRYVKVVYNDNESAEIFNGFEVKDGGYFEVMSSCVCN
jgi:hypothetical protein